LNCRWFGTQNAGWVEIVFREATSVERIVLPFSEECNPTGIKILTSTDRQVYNAEALRVPNVLAVPTNILSKVTSTVLNSPTDPNFRNPYLFLLEFQNPF
jgi:hypothetical protein